MTEVVEIFNREKWEVPDYNISLWKKKKHDWCVIIPVINEGVRIRNELDKMNINNVCDVADIIIIDGGSTDGSLELNFLEEKNVTGLLTKIGPGGLSAQLRCAYAFALDQGYKGIVTIDGNDKDDSEAIPRFIDALIQGVDFVQASRYIVGGVAENTPMIRNIAIRLIHAPMLTLCSGFKWTDTTQGFRAYSRKMLISPDISVFRDIFITYELLAYLSYRAPILGFKCLELPTKRYYPKKEVPTKISGFAGNVSVLKILFKACIGLYNPRTTSECRKR